MHSEILVFFSLFSKMSGPSLKALNIKITSNKYKLIYSCNVKLQPVVE